MSEELKKKLDWVIGPGRNGGNSDFTDLFIAARDELTRLQGVETERDKLRESYSTLVSDSGKLRAEVEALRECVKYADGRLPLTAMWDRLRRKAGM